jgi:hypothetical protein
MMHDQQIRHKLKKVQYLVSGDTVTWDATECLWDQPGVQDAAEAEEGIEKRPLAQRRASLKIREGCQIFLLLRARLSLLALLVLRRFRAYMK